eukprot:XP_001701576.1 predicted protein [Chlamydomonas reinhardtii]
MAKVVKIERQDKPHVSAISFDRNAANVFQSYLQGAFNFSIKRGGILYGTVLEEEGPEPGKTETHVRAAGAPPAEAQGHWGPGRGWRRHGVVVVLSTPPPPIA